jgi:hypothetical protein
MAKDLNLIKAKNLLLPQHRRHPSWIEFRVGLIGSLHKFGTEDWLCAPYIKQVGKNRFRINAGGVASIECPVPTCFLRCMHPNLEGTRKNNWDHPDEDGRMRKRPTSVS